MKTDDLLSVLAADTVPQPTVGQRMTRALPVAFVLSVAAFLLFWALPLACLRQGWRPRSLP